MMRGDEIDWHWLSLIRIFRAALFAICVDGSVGDKMTFLRFFAFLTKLIALLCLVWEIW